MNVWIFSNEDAGRGLSDSELRAVVEGAGHTVTGLETTFNVDTRPDHAALDLIVSAGGDGTTAAVAAISARTSIPMAILPLGTANNIANGLGIERDIHRLVARWKHADRIRLDLGCARSGAHAWTVVEGVGAGLVAAGMGAAERVLKRSNADPNPRAEVETAIAVFEDVLKALEPVHLTITLDDVERSEAFLFVEVLNMPAIGPNLLLAPDASPSDGLFHVVLAEPQHRSALLSYLESRLLNREHRLSLPTYPARQARIQQCGEVHIDDERVDLGGVGDIHVTMDATPAIVFV